MAQLLDSTDVATFLQCYKDPATRDGSSRIVAFRVKAGDLSKPWPKRIQFRAAPRTNEVRTPGDGAPANWIDADVLACETDGDTLVGWRVDNVLFEPTDEMVGFAVRDPLSGGDLPLPSDQRLYIEGSWGEPSQLDPWPGGMAQQRAATPGFWLRSVLALGIFFFIGGVIAVVGSTRREPPVTALSIVAETYPGGEVHLDFDGKYRDKVKIRDGRPFEVSIAHDAQLGTVETRSKRELVYTAPWEYRGPDGDKPVTDRFKYAVQLDNGAADQRAVAVVEVRIANRLPSARPYQHAQPIRADQAPVNFDLSGVISDEDPAHRDRLVVHSCDENPFGRLEPLAGGLGVWFTPNGQPGKAIDGRCQVRDPFGAMADVPLLFDVAAVDLPFPPIGPLPVAVGAALPVAPGDWFRQHGHPDLSGLTVVSVEQPDQPDRGSARLDGGRILYSAPVGHKGTVTFRYQARDADGRERPGSVTVEVQNQPPRLETIRFTDAVAGQPKTVDVSPYVHDPDADRGQTWSLTVPPDPRFAVRGNTITVTPRPEDGDFQWRFRVTDQAGDSAEGAITVQVAQRDIDFGTLWVREPVRVGEAKSLDLASLTPDWGPNWQLDDAPLTASIDVPRRTDAKTITFQAPVDKAGETRIPFTVTGRDGRRGRGEIALTVQNQPPTARDLGLATRADQPVTIDLANAVSDSDAQRGQSLRVEVVQRPAFGSLTAANGRSLRFDPQGQAGTATGTYRAIDGAGGESEVRQLVVTVSAPDSVVQNDSQQVLSGITKEIRAGNVDGAIRQCREAAQGGNLEVALHCGNAFSRNPGNDPSTQEPHRAFAKAMYELAQRSPDKRIAEDAQQGLEWLRKQ